MSFDRQQLRNCAKKSEKFNKMAVKADEDGVGLFGKIGLTLDMAVKAGSQEFSRSCTRSWMQLEMTLKEFQDVSS